MTELHIGGVAASQLVAQYGSPLYVYDQQQLETNLQAYKQAFQSDRFPTKILYASKAFQTVGMMNLVNQYGFGVDVVSAGELYTALQSDVPVDHIYFHGNNKSTEELKMAFESGMQHIVCDNLMELTELSQLANDYKQPMQIMFRLNVGIEAHTHEYIVTTHIDSKFGMAYDSSDFKACLELLNDNDYLELEGFHVHIGSQIFEMDAWYAAIDKMVSYLNDFDQPLTLNLGGGFGVRYTEDDKPLGIEETMNQLLRYLDQSLTAADLTVKELIIEPGRSLVAEAGYTLYEIGYQKQTPNKTYYFVDGGMADNIRPSLYQAKYSCDVANKMDAEKTEHVTVAGKYCESGDVLIQDVALPKVEKGDLLVVYATGAYGYSMSSNYNRSLTPAVVFAKDGQTTEIVKRQTYLDLLRNDLK
ncbi:MAG TPA: diaminopimelate decarboxylase [Weissella thailandensis]|uniref:Diaminopimelate decarboxylase n=1 Tax=Jeotgalibaca arthritidis TaxID=1868794 RepID=A0A6G7K8N3_9LACT|nr:MULTISPECIES: diaminopimelate decarboxylase [Lactobacillales]QII81610.1 diaminopimelate decarboxylase [Jeotgalibaca arthritidis]HJG84698.1 diaminopimelate decarboxylase [Weissella thailandensis]